MTEIPFKMPALAAGVVATYVCEDVAMWKVERCVDKRPKRSQADAGRQVAVRGIRMACYVTGINVHVIYPGVHLVSHAQNYPLTVSHFSRKKAITGKYKGEFPYIFLSRSNVQVDYSGSVVIALVLSPSDERPFVHYPSFSSRMKIDCRKDHLADPSVFVDR